MSVMVVLLELVCLEIGIKKGPENEGLVRCCTHSQDASGQPNPSGGWAAHSYVGAGMCDDVHHELSPIMCPSHPFFKWASVRQDSNCQWRCPFLGTTKARKRLTPRLQLENGSKDLRFAAGIVREAFSKTHNEAKRCRGAKRRSDRFAHQQRPLTRMLPLSTIHRY